MLDITKNNNGIIIDGRCFLNETFKRQYIARLRWLCYSINMKQAQTILLYCEICDRLSAAAGKGVLEYKKLNPNSKNDAKKTQDTIDSEICDIEDCLFKTLTENLFLKQNIESSEKMVQYISELFEEVSNIKNILKQQARDTFNILKREMEKYDINTWSNADFTPLNLPRIKRKNIRILVSFVHFLQIYIEGFIKIDYNIATHKDIQSYQTLIKQFGHLLVFQCCKREDLYDLTEDEINQLYLESTLDKDFCRIIKEFDGFISTAFKEAINQFTNSNSGFQNLIKQEIINKQENNYKNKGKGLQIDRLFDIVEKLGYDKNEMKVPIVDEFFLPMFLAGAKQENFEEVFPILEIYAHYDLTPIVKDRYYQKFFPKELSPLLKAILKYPYSSDESLEYLNFQCGKGIFHSLLTTDQMKNAFCIVTNNEPLQEEINEEEIDEIEDDLDDETYVKEFALFNVYEKYPEVKKYLEDITEEYPELKEKLSL